MGNNLGYRMYVLFVLNEYRGIDVYRSYRAEERLQTFGEQILVGRTIYTYILQRSNNG